MSRLIHVVFAALTIIAALAIGSCGGGSSGGSPVPDIRIEPNYAVSVGQTLAFIVNVSDASDDLVLPSVSPVPLPANASFDVETGLFTWAPNLAQVGASQFTFSAQNAVGGLTTQSTQVTVVSRSNGATDLVGFVYDSATEDETLPLESVVVRMLGSSGTEIEATTDAFGRFFLPDVDATTETIFIDGTGIGYAFVAEDVMLLTGHPLHIGQENNIQRPVYLPALGPAVGNVVSGRPTLIYNSALNIEMAMRANSVVAPDGSNYEGPIYMPEVPANRTPAALPANMRPGLVVAIQPAGLTFTQPATLRWPNLDDLEPGTTLDLWSVDATSGQFEDVGDLRVSPDGTELTTTSGGIINSSWHFPTPGPGDGTGETGDSNDQNQNCQNQCKAPVGSRVALQTGSLVVEHNLVRYRSVGADRGLTLVYNSHTASPMPAVNADLFVPSGTSVPETFSTRFQIAGVHQPFEAFTEASRDTVRIACVFDGRTFPTGWYPHQLDLWSNYQQSSIASSVLGGTLVNNETDSPYGCGWSVKGLQRIHPVVGTNRVVLSEGDGSVKLFIPQSTTQIVQATDLCFAIDGSGSIDPTEFTLMIEGIASAIEDPLIVPQDGSISIGVVQFPSRSTSNPEVPLTIVDSEASAQALAQVIRGIVRATGSTPMTQGINDSATLLVNGTGLRQVMCVATDGAPDNQMSSIAAADEAVRRGVEELDAIAIGTGASVMFLEMLVRNGFVESAASFESFAATVGQKIKRVVSGAPPGEYSIVFEESDGSFRRDMVNKTKHFFDPSGQLIRSADRNGNETTYTYQPSGEVASMTDPAGLQTRFSYIAGRLSEVAHPDGRFTRFQHDGNGALLNITDPDGRARQFSYSPIGKLTSQRDKQGFETTYQYDATGRLENATEVTSGMTRASRPSETLAVVASPQSTSALNPAAPAVLSDDVASMYVDAEGKETKVVAHRLGAPLLVTDPLGREIRWERNQNGNPTDTIQSNGRADEARFDSRNGQATLVREATGTATQRAMEYQYHPDFGFVTEATDAGGFTTTYDYDPNTGDLLRVTDPAGGELTFTYTNQGLLATSTNKNGNTTTYDYDGTSRLERVTDALRHVTIYGRDSRGNATSITEGAGSSVARSQTFTYDDMDRVTSITDGAGATTRFDYDSRGNLTRTSLPTGESIIREYDSMGQLTRLVDPLRGENTFTYDLRNNLKSRRDALGRTTRSTYDDAGQLTEMIDARGGVERYTYDDSGNVERFRNASGSTTRFSFDQFNRRELMVTPQGRVRRWIYDPRDNMVAEVQPGDVTIRHEYDELSRREATRVLAVGGAPANSITFQYDAVGNLRFVADNDTQLERTYDALDRVLEEKTLAGGIQPVTTLTSSYNAVGDRTMLVDSEGGSHTYGHDGAGRLSSVGTPEVGNIAMDYDRSGRMRTVTFPNSVTGAYSYTGNGRISGIRYRPASGADILSLTYQTGQTGNIDRITDSGTNKDYGYDKLDRLTTASELSPRGYAYDSVGNRTQSDLTSVAIYNRDNQLVQDDAGFYAYDQRGNLVTEPGQAANVFVWNAHNQLVEVNGTSTYRYDGLGRRVEKVTPSGTRRYVYDADNILLEYDGSNQLLSRYTHGEQVDQHLATTRGGAAFYYHTDHLGSVRSLTDRAGSEANRYRYDPYGRVIERMEGVENPYWYTGREEASEIGWYYYRARWYEARSGRFVGEDPFLFSGTAATYYEYALGSPTMYVDTDGQDPSLGMSLVGQGGGLVGSGAAITQITPIIPGPDDVVGAGLIVIGGGLVIVGGAVLAVEAIGALCSDDSTQQDDAKAPGPPSTEDGWKPPKKWDGKPVKNPNGPGKGWPDKKGDVWVPTGPGGSAHGGPHWDVQSPGGGYTNVYPGGKVR